MSLLSLIPIVGNIIDVVKTWGVAKQNTELEKYRVDGKINSDLIAADTERIRAAKDLQIATAGYAGDRWMRYLFAYPLGFWWVMLMFDSTFGRGFDLPTTAFRLPSPADEWSGWIIGYLFLHSTITQVLKRG